MKDTLNTEMGDIYISSEQIIHEVQKYKCLYDPSDPEHKDRDVMKDAWLSVTAAVVGEPWDSLNSAEKNEAEKAFKRRWRDMKDTFRKSLMKGCFPSLCDGSTKRPYCYYKQMCFLLETEFQKYVPDGVDISATKLKRPSPVVDQVRPRPGFQIVRPEKEKYSHPRPFKLSGQKGNNTIESDDSSSSSHSSISVPHISPEPDDAMQVQNVDSFVHQNTTMPDPDSMFFLSILPRVSSLSNRDKLDFQINVMKLLQGYETDDSAT